ncbi:putative signal transducing protein [Chloroflexota bacterium]
MNKGKMVEVYRAVGEMEAQVIKGLLESYAVPCLLKSVAAPSVHPIAVDGMGEVKIMVWEQNEAEAKRLIRGKENA